MRLPRLFRTTVFKLAALFALVFSMSSVAVGAFVYANMQTTLNRQERTRLQADAIALKGEYDNGGLTDMMTAIHQRKLNKLAGGLNYTLFKSNGERLFGDLPKVPLKPGWKHLLGPPDGDEPPGELEKLLVYRQQLSPELWLVIGDDIGRLHDLSNEFLQIFALGLLLALALAVSGGVAVSLTFLRRIDSINRTAEAIIEGDIARRVSLRGSGDDLDRLALTLNRMLDRIGGLMDTLRHVSTNIAHDLRTPLGHLRQTLDEVHERDRSIDEYRAAVSKGIAETDTILETFSAILRIAQIESGSRRSGFRRVSLSDIATHIAQSFTPTAEEQDHALASQIEAGVEIVGDRELITQLLANLIDNAIRHTPAGARIVLTLRTQNDTAVLEVSDNGAGVPEAERELIFNRFYRGEASRTTLGNGLGLSLVAAVAGLHHASIAVIDNAPGLCVRIGFPMGESHA